MLPPSSPWRWRLGVTFLKTTIWIYIAVKTSGLALESGRLRTKCWRECWTLERWTDRESCRAARFGDRLKEGGTWGTMAEQMLLNVCLKNKEVDHLWDGKPWPLYPQGKSPWYPLDRKLGGPRAILDAVVKKKIPSSCRETNPRTPIVQPVAQRYTDWAITALEVVFTVSIFSRYLLVCWYLTCAAV
jgi:hypothetical protein